MNEKLPPITPGEILLEEFLEPLGVSQNKLARDIDVPVGRINDIVHGRKTVRLLNRKVLIPNLAKRTFVLKTHDWRIAFQFHNAYAGQIVALKGEVIGSRARGKRQRRRITAQLEPPYAETGSLEILCHHAVPALGGHLAAVDDTAGLRDQRDYRLFALRSVLDLVAVYDRVRGRFLNF